MRASSGNGKSGGTPVFLGDIPARHVDGPVTGAFARLDGETFYKIGRCDRLPPFFMSMVSDGDHWLFASSNGALTAGRGTAEQPLFPYCTDDKIHDAQDQVGGKTLFLVERPGGYALWEPLSDRCEGAYAIERNLYKSVYGHQIRYEEVNLDLELVFVSAWSVSRQFGFVKRSMLRNVGSRPVRVWALDGLLNIMPYGVPQVMQADRSNLVDAYKKSEWYGPAGPALFALSSIPVDKPEPSEALRATVAWSVGLDAEAHLLSAAQLDRFRRGLAVEQEEDARGVRGAYFVQGTFEAPPGGERVWHVAADVGQGPDQVIALRALLNAHFRGETDLAARIAQDVREGGERLARLVAAADGVQQTAEPMMAARHFSHVLFNVMRGGVFAGNGQVSRSGLADFLRRRNRRVAARRAAWIADLPDETPVSRLLADAAALNDPQMERLCHEYLPLTFGRRHGDPSRPWNRFAIDTHNEDGSRKIAYEGNWRDIFQNWEALAFSFPEYVESMVCKFVNASTPDGYNPYRLTQDGIDWEVLDPNDPWSYIGYWGDHQIAYLLKLLECSRMHHPGKLEAFLDRKIFAYADVPYRIRPYRALIENPHETIDFDDESAAGSARRAAEIGGDGKLVPGADGNPYLVNLAEKLLVAILARLASFIPEGGVWMNTQRPEWNDANNALVGYGVSMVTLCYLHRFARLVADLFAAAPRETLEISEEVAGFAEAISDALGRFEPLAAGPWTDEDRKKAMDALGEAGSAYRRQIYERGFSGRAQPVRLGAALTLLDRAATFASRSIRAARRPDGLFHAYNLLSVSSADAVAIRPMYEMLEGQVAALSAGTLSGQEALEVLSAMRAGPLYCPRRNTYLLYPDRRLPRFLEKNRIGSERVERIPLLEAMASAGDRRLILQDEEGGWHFHGAFRNADSVRAALDALRREEGYARAVQRDGEAVLALFEAVFDHRSYTGRSGTFYGYEGLGSVYWHMVSKLLLAVLECFRAAEDAGEDEAVRRGLAEQYYAIRSGLGMHRTPEQFGAFPSDPYSHTPAHAGAQQPGMTGQVKEDILCRWGELGVLVRAGRIHFRPTLLRRGEFLTRPAAFRWYDTEGRRQTMELLPDMLAFTCCQTAFAYRVAEEAGIHITDRDGATRAVAGSTLDRASSESIFRREGAIRKVEVALTPGWEG